MDEVHLGEITVADVERVVPHRAPSRSDGAAEAANDARADAATGLSGGERASLWTALMRRGPA